jgi:hypothetical protein
MLIPAFLMTSLLAALVAQGIPPSVASESQPNLIDRNELLDLINPVQIVRTSFESDRGRKVLSIWQKRLVRFGRLVTLADGLTHADSVFMVIDAEEPSPQESRVLSVFYAATYGAAGDNRWPFDIVWHPMRKEAYVVQVFSTSFDARFSVFLLDLDKNKGRWPLQFDHGKKNEWPREPKAVASWRMQLPPRRKQGDSYGIEKISVIVEDQQLLISCERRNPEHATLYLRYHLGSKEWTEWLPSQE